MSSIDIYPLIYMYTPLRSPNHPGEICMAPGSAVAMPAVCILCEKPCDEAPGRLGYVAASEQDAQIVAVCHWCSSDRHDRELEQKIAAKMDAYSKTLQQPETAAAT